jgi:pilus assembly protein Flp/PilA
MKNLIQRLVRDEEGQDLIEYAFLIAFIALAIIGGMGAFGGNIGTLFTDLGNAVASS